MKLYWYLFKNTLASYSIYRLNFLLWRLRMVIGVLIPYYFWQALLSQQAILFGYTYSTIISYVFISYFISTVVLATQTSQVGEEIHSGNLTNFLLKPTSYFSYVWIRDVGDKLINISFCIGEISMLLLILHEKVAILYSPMILLFFLLTLLGATILFFIISILLGFIGFWSAEVWAPRFILFVLLYLISGIQLPVDVYPSFLYRILIITPFPYLVYFPTKIILGHLRFEEIVQVITMQIGWIGLLICFTYGVWHKGLQIYTAEGR